MYPAKDAREMSILLRISRELDVVGDVTATVDSPSELLAWALALSNPRVHAWRAGDSGHRYLHVAARRDRPPIRGCVTAVLACDEHQEYWDALGLRELGDGDSRDLDVAALSSAWAQMPTKAPDAESAREESRAARPGDSDAP